VASFSIQLRSGMAGNQFLEGKAVIERGQQVIN
jgi:hypothetical protein